MDQGDKFDGDGDDEVSTALPWPSALHSLTRPGGNWALTSSIRGWSGHSATSRIMGYREAAELVFQRLVQDRGGRDTLVYPLVFL
jgi:hypothetical protein